MQNKFFGSKINTFLLIILIILTGFLLWKMNHGGSIILSTDSENDPVEMYPNTDKIIKTVLEKKENKTAPVSNNSVLQNIFNQYKDGSIAECVDNGQTYYSAGMNAYDGGGQTFDSTGKVVGEYQGFTGKYTGVVPKNCTDIYVVTPNVWGKAGVNKYNLK